MSNIKLKVKNAYEVKDKKGNERVMIETTMSTTSPPCKLCKKEPRKEGSSRCKKCSEQHVIQKINDSRLQAKINKQINK